MDYHTSTTGARDAFGDERDRADPLYSAKLGDLWRLYIWPLQCVFFPFVVRGTHILSPSPWLSRVQSREAEGVGFGRRHFTLLDRVALVSRQQTFIVGICGGQKGEPTGVVPLCFNVINYRAALGGFLVGNWALNKYANNGIVFLKAWCQTRGSLAEKVLILSPTRCVRRCKERVRR